LFTFQKKNPSTKLNNIFTAFTLELTNITQNIFQIKKPFILWKNSKIKIKMMKNLKIPFCGFRSINLNSFSED
jgi:hypothetical protein